jgi:hypothetical protein
MSEIDPYRPYLTADEREQIIASGNDPSEIQALKNELQLIILEKAESNPEPSTDTEIGTAIGRGALSNGWTKNQIVTGIKRTYLDRFGPARCNSIYKIATTVINEGGYRG